MKTRNLKTFSSVAPTCAGTSYTGCGFIYLQTLKFELVDKETELRLSHGYVSKGHLWIRLLRNHSAKSTQAHARSLARVDVIESRQ